MDTWLTPKKLFEFYSKMWGNKNYKDKALNTI